MVDSKFIAGFVGPTLVVLSISEMINYHIWEVNLAAVTYLNGMMLFLSGLVILRLHNLWVPDWRVCVTLVGWMCLFGGLYRLFAPEAPQAAPNAITYGLMTVLLLVGIVLTYKAYLQKSS
jgi:hypothetical protein